MIEGSNVEIKNIGGRTPTHIGGGNLDRQGAEIVTAGRAGKMHGGGIKR